MIRSSEVMRNAKPAKMPPKVLSHMAVHPQMGGGVRVEHHHTEPGAHPIEAHEFGPKEGGAFHDHMAAQTGMSWNDGDGNANDVNKEGTEAE